MQKLKNSFYAVAIKINPFHVLSDKWLGNINDAILWAKDISECEHLLVCQESNIIYQCDLKEDKK